MEGAILNGRASRRDNYNKIEVAGDLSAARQEEAMIAPLAALIIGIVSAGQVNAVRPAAVKASEVEVMEAVDSMVVVITGKEQDEVTERRSKSVQCDIKYE